MDILTSLPPIPPQDTHQYLMWNRDTLGDLSVSNDTFSDNESTSNEPYVKSQPSMKIS